MRMRPADRRAQCSRAATRQHGAIAKALRTDDATRLVEHLAFRRRLPVGKRLSVSLNEGSGRPEGVTHPNFADSTRSELNT